jgi:hypothetical protein
MLPGDVSLQQLIPTTGPLRCELPLDRLERGPVGNAPATPTENDQRRFRRQPVFCAAALQHVTTIKALPRAVEWHKVVLLNVGRGGVGFLHSRQLYPSERLQLIFPDLRPRYIEVVRCRKLGSQCFEVGAQFVSSSESRKPLHAGAAGS